MLPAYEAYQKAVEALADEFAYERVREFDNPVVAVLARTWLRREAAEAYFEQTKTSLSVVLAGFAKIKPMPVAELARHLHTDRPNLTRRIKQVEAMNYPFLSLD